METKKHKRYKFSGFTLVELIVVITILAILGTISFIQLQGFAGSARDSIRIENLSSLHKGLTLFNTISSTYPMPEGTVTISASGTDIGYQGFAKDTVGSIAKLSKGATQDPSDATIYTTYSVNANQTKMQLMSFLEGGGNITTFVPNAYANMGSDYSKRSPLVKGDSLGILLASGSLQPVQESESGIDIANTNTEYLVLFSRNDGVSGTGNTLFSHIYNRNIELLNKKGLASLDPSLVGYWDMETFSGIMLKDFSKYGNDGTLSGGLIAGGIQGSNSRGTQFNGIENQGIFIPNSSAFDVKTTDDFTILIVTKAPLVQTYTNGAHHYNCLLEKWGLGDGYPFTMRIKDQKDSAGYDIYSAGNPGKMLTARYDNINNPGVYSNKNIADDIFHNLVFKKIGQHLSNYIDGTKDAEGIDTITGNTISTSPLVIGACTNGSLPYSGIIDEVRIYNRALSDPEIQTLYNATK